MRPNKHCAQLSINWIEMGLLLIGVFLFFAGASRVGAQDIVLNTGEGFRVGDVTLLRILYVAGGAALLFAGWYFYRVALGIAGLIAGATFGMQLAATSFGGDPLWTAGLAVALGLVGMALALFAYYIGVFFIGGYVGLVVTAQLFLWLFGDMASTPVLAIGALVGGLLFTALAFELTALLTAAAGAVIFGTGLGFGERPLGALWILVLFLVGLAVQIGLARSQGQSGFRRRQAVA